MTQRESENTSRRQARQDWLSFFDSRISPDGPFLSTSDAQVVDDELQILDELAALLKKRRNARVAWLCRLPIEMLTMIFEELKIIWGAEMWRLADHEEVALKKSQKSGPLSEWRMAPRHNVFGWLNITFVCSKLREAALATPSLWCDIECSRFSPSFASVIESRSAGQPLRYTIDYRFDPIKRCHEWTEVWLTPSVCERLRSLGLNNFGNCQLIEIVQPLPHLPCLTDLSWGHETYHDVLPVLADVVFPVAPRQLARLAFHNAIPPFSNPVFSPSVTHLALSWTLKANARIPPISDILDMLCSLIQLEELRLDNIPVATYPSTHSHSPPKARRRLLPSLRRLEIGCYISIESLNAESAFKILSHIQLPRGVEIRLRNRGDEDVRSEGMRNVSRFASLADEAFSTNCDLRDAPWSLLLLLNEAYILLGDGASVQQPRSPSDRRSLVKIVKTDTLLCLTRPPHAGPDYIDNKGLTRGDLNGLCQLFPLGNLTSITLSGKMVQRLFSDEARKCAYIVDKFFGVQGIRHLSLGIIASATYLFERLAQIRVHEDGTGTAALLPSLETIHIGIDACDNPCSHEVLAPVCAALAAVVNARRKCINPICEVRVGRDLRALYEWESLAGTRLVVV